MIFGTQNSEFTVLETRGLLTESNKNKNNKKKNNNNNKKVTLRTAFRG